MLACNSNENNLDTLIVEDEMETVRGTLHALKRKGLTFNNVLCTEDAISAIKEKHYRLLVVDVRLPFKHGDTSEDDAGIEFIKNLQKGEYGSLNQRTPFIVLTAQDSTIRIEEIDIYNACLGVFAKLQYKRLVNQFDSILEKLFRKP